MVCGSREMSDRLIDGREAASLRMRFGELKIRVSCSNELAAAKGKQKRIVAELGSISMSCRKPLAQQDGISNSWP